VPIFLLLLLDSVLFPVPICDVLLTVHSFVSGANLCLIATRRKFVSPAVKITCIVFFWALVPYSLADDCNLFVGTYCIILQGMKHDVVVKGDCTMSLSRRPQCELVLFFFCAAAIQRGSWPTHS
jgi:hypothetical protein